MELLRQRPLCCRAFLKLMSLMAMLAGISAHAEDLRLDTTSQELLLSYDGYTLPVSLLSPRLVLDNSTVVEPVASTSRDGSLDGEKALVLTYPPVAVDQNSTVEFHTTLRWFPSERAIRKEVSVRLQGPSPRVVQEAVLDSIDLDRSGLADRQPLFMPPQSYPLLLKGFFAGIEYPIASSRIEGKRGILAHKPGATLRPGEWYNCRTAIYAAAQPGMEYRSFRDYIVSRMPEPPAYHTVFDHWLSTTLVYSEQEMVDLMQLLKTKLYDGDGPGLDYFRLICVWSDPKSIWEIDRNRLPNEFDAFNRVAKSMGTQLGLWISPASCYPFAQDPVWARDNGYETYSTSVEGVGEVVQTCMAGRRYHEAFKANLLKAVTQNDIRHIQFDGYRFECSAKDHGHEPDGLSCEAIADGFLDVCRAVRNAVPGIHLHAAFGSNPSPWWLLDLNTTLVHYGADAPYGRIPAPVYFESYTTARDSAYLQAATYVLTPIAAQDVYGFYDHSPDAMGNDLIMSTLRGHLLSSIIVHPGYRSKSDWTAIRRALKFARSHADVLKNTEPLLPRSWQDGNVPKLVLATMPKEPYGYAHWNDKEALVVLRNPWIVPQTYSLPLAGQPYTPQGKNLTAVGIYPEPRNYGSGPLGDRLDVPLAPYETVILSISAEAPSEGLVPAIEATGNRLKAVVSSKHAQRLVFNNPVDFDASTSRSLVGELAQATRFTLAADVDINAPCGDLLVLIEDTRPPVDPIGTIRVNGEVREPLYSPSEIGWAADVPPRPEHWLFLVVPLETGRQTIEVELVSRSTSGRLSMWVLAKKNPPADLAALPCGLPYPETINLDSLNLLEPFDLAASDIPSVDSPRPVETIDGIYLDTMETALQPEGAAAIVPGKNVAEAPLAIRGRYFDRGLGMKAPSRVRLPLDGNYKRFQARVGVDQGMAPYDQTRLAFKVLVDGEVKWDSGTMSRYDAARLADVDIAGAKVLELVVDDPVKGYERNPVYHTNYGDWAEARLMR